MDSPATEVLAASGPVMLVVGRLSTLQRGPRVAQQVAAVAPTQDLHFCEYQELAAEVLHDIQPTVVLSVLLGPDFDALDLARRLRELGYTGMYRALTAGLPDPALVRAEVANVAPDLDFELFNISAAMGSSAR